MGEQNIPVQMFFYKLDRKNLKRNLIILIKNGNSTYYNRCAQCEQYRTGDKRL